MAIELNDLISLFLEVCDDAAAFAQLSVRRPHHQMSENASHIKYDTTELIKKALEVVETQPLSIPLMIGAIQYIKQIYAVSLEELLSGEFEPRRRRFELLNKELESSPIAIEWKNSQAKISEIIERLELIPDKKLLDDMPRTAGIILNAFGFFTSYYTNIVKVAAGKYISGKPTFLYTMPRFSTTGEFFDFFHEAPLDNAIMIGMIAPTYAQNSDSLAPWKKEISEKYENPNHWYEEERIRNMRQHDKNFNPETTTDKYGSRVVVGVKRGGNVWLIIHQDESSHHGDFINYHGKRTSYMPFQVLFKDAPVPNDDCTDIVVANKGSWNLLSILDAEQALWLPTFLWLIEKKFFSGEADSTEEVVYLPDMVQCLESQVNPHLPVVHTRLRIAVDPFVLPEEYGYTSCPECVEFIKHLQISKRDLDGAVFTPTTPFADEETYTKELWFLQRSALAFIAKTKLAADYRENYQSLNQKIAYLIENNRNFLVSELENPDSMIHEMSEHVIDKQPSVTNGILDMTPDRYINKKVPLIMNTSAHHTRSHYYSTHSVICVPPTLTGNRPPVTIILSPKTKEQYSFVTGIPENELPWQLVLAGKCTDRSHNPFNNTKCDPMTLLDNPYKNLPIVYISFGKREYKAIFPNRILSKKQISEVLK